MGPDPNLKVTTRQAFSLEFEGALAGEERFYRIENLPEGRYKLFHTGALEPNNSGVIPEYELRYRKARCGTRSRPQPPRDLLAALNRPTACHCQASRLERSTRG